jgi:hypothetical protein
MPVATWPSELPEHLEREGFGEEFPDTRIRSETDMGPELVRQRSTAHVGKMDGNLILTVEQVEVFREFWNVDLQGGVLPFYWVNPFNLEENRLYRFSQEPPKISVLGYNTFKVALELEILP